MKLTDNFLMILAGFCLYSMMLVFSNEYFAGINKLIPDLFSGQAMITIGETFHLVIASIVTGFLFTRFAANPVLIALITAVVLKLEVYILLFTSDAYRDSYSYYQSNPSEILTLLKPLIILPAMTYLLGLIRYTDVATEQHSD